MTEFNLTEAAHEAAEKHGLDKEKMYLAAKQIVAEFKEQLMNMDEIHLRGFGSFKVKKRYFPMNLEFSSEKKAKLKIVFKASPVLEDEINKANL